MQEDRSCVGEGPVGAAFEHRGVADDAVVVCLVTGSGFKDAASVERMTAENPVPVVDWSTLPERLG